MNLLKILHRMVKTSLRLDINPLDKNQEDSFSKNDSIKPL